MGEEAVKAISADELRLRQRKLDILEGYVANMAVSRDKFFGQVFDQRRDYEKECGLPSLDAPIKPEGFRRLYARESLARRVVEVLPKESWQVLPSVYEDKDPKVQTEFERAWDELPKKLNGQSWFKQEHGSPIWEHLLRADVISGIGRYGVIVLGINDSRRLDQPVEFQPGTTATRELTYVRTFSETSAAIIEVDKDEFSPRFGQPVMYEVTVSNPMAMSGEDGVAFSGGVSGTTTTTRKVHWTRVIHLADNLGSSEVYGTPRMEPVYDKLLNLHKLYCGSAEMYWKGALPGWAVESNPQLDPNTLDVNMDDMRSAFENYSQGLQRFLEFSGFTIKSLAPQVVDPTPQIAVQIEGVCIQLDIPLRKFKGSERGELASSQDDDDWNDTLRSRQNLYVTPRVIRPFVDRLIQVGVLPAPKEYFIDWPVLGNISKKDKAAIAVQMSNALAQYVQNQVEAIMPVEEFLTYIWDLDEAEVVAIVKAARKNLDPLTLHLAMQGQPDPADLPDNQTQPNGRQKKDPDAPRDTRSVVRKTGQSKPGVSS